MVLQGPALGESQEEVRESSAELLVIQEYCVAFVCLVMVFFRGEWDGCGAMRVAQIKRRIRKRGAPRANGEKGSRDPSQLWGKWSHAV